MFRKPCFIVTQKSQNANVKNKAQQTKIKINKIKIKINKGKVIVGSSLSRKKGQVI